MVVHEARALVAALLVVPPQQAGPVHQGPEDDGTGDGAQTAQQDGLETQGQGALRGLDGSGITWDFFMFALAIVGLTVRVLESPFETYQKNS